jgi:hypothetical protein
MTVIWKISRRDPFSDRSVRLKMLEELMVPPQLQD